MRLMLGYNNEPYLLVYCNPINTDKFKFYVSNGNWDGLYDNGTITVFKDDKIVNRSFGWRILSDDQDLLQGEDYNDVFLRFKNE